jgi:response regulator RpfG family c-di-GMP phosphodiesterase
LSLLGPISSGQALPKGVEQALAFFEEQKEKMFDPPLVDIFKGRVT